MDEAPHPTLQSPADLAGLVRNLGDDDLRQLFGEVVREYSVRTQRTVDAGQGAWAPLSAHGPATATDVLIATRNMLKVFEIAPFELGFLDY
jgi:hypothetical protein